MAAASAAHRRNRLAESLRAPPKRRRALTKQGRWGAKVEREIVFSDPHERMVSGPAGAFT